MPPRKSRPRSVTVSGYEAAALLLANRIRGACPTMELVRLAAHVMDAANMHKSDRTIRKHLGDLVTSGVLFQKKIGKFVLVRRNPRVRTPDQGHFGAKFQERLPSLRSGRWTPDELREWEEVRQLLRRAEAVVPEVRPSGAVLLSKVKPLERVPDGEQLEAERILASPLVVRFLFRGGPPAELCRRLARSIEAFHAHLDRLDSNPEFADAQAAFRDMPSLGSAPTILALRAAARQGRMVRAIVKNLGLDGAEVRDFLARAVPLATAAANAFRSASAAERKLRKHLRTHAELPRPLRLSELSGT